MTIHMAGYEAKVVVALSLVNISSAHFQSMIDNGYAYDAMTGFAADSAHASKLLQFMGREREQRNEDKENGRPKQLGEDRLRKFTEQWKKDNHCPPPCSHVEMWKSIDKHPKSPF